MWYSTVGCLVTLICALLAVPLAADAQPAEPVRRIGWLRGNAPRPDGREAFLHGLRDMGYVEGQNLIIELRLGEGNAAPLPTLAAELVRLPVEVLVSASIAATLAAKAATSTIPIVFTNVPDPVDHGLIASWARPGGNITGAANAGQEAVGKNLELLKEVVPTATRIAVLVNPANPFWQAVGLKALQTAARLLPVELHLMQVRDPATELERAFAALASEPVDALYVAQDPSFVPHAMRIVELVTASRMPAIYLYKTYVQAGGLMSYEMDPLDIQRRAGVMVGKILRGAKPGDIPAEYPMKYELSINLKTAKALGLTISPHLLSLADEVIQEAWTGDLHGGVDQVSGTPTRGLESRSGSTSPTAPRGIPSRTKACS
jgi:putative ABC transport system substrate-binding protein